MADNNIDDSRSFKRRQIRAAVSYRLSERMMASLQPATLVDLSADGIGIKVKENLKVGAFVDIEIEPISRMGKVAQQAQVCVVTPEADGSFKIGLRWRQRLDYLDLQRLL